MINIEQIANNLGSAKQNGDSYICKCPCHDDKTASLSITLSEKGRLVFNCFAGCDWKDIRETLQDRGLIARELKTTPRVTGSVTTGGWANRYDGATFYTYKDIAGNVLCRKVKLPSKKMWFERLEGNTFKSGLSGMAVPLYNIKAVAESDIIYLCEGEKDAESLISRGYCATTNSTGATSWQPHLTEQLKGKTVIVIPDNDEAGKRRVSIVSRALQGAVKELRCFILEGVPTKGDVTDWLEAGGDPAVILPKSSAIEKQKEAKKATRAEYYELFKDVLNNPRRCIFNEKLMTYSEASGLWNPCVNSLEIIKSEALLLNETRTAKFAVSNIQPHFFAYEAAQPLEFLVDIPEWDGEDRIGAMCSLITLKKEAGVSESSMAELIKEWCGLVFQRLHDPMIQNRILILQGGQGIGKDTWTSMLIDGLGQFCIPLAVVKEDKDTYLNLHRGLVMKISEFDKTAKTEVSTLKDIITAPSTNLRAPYDKDSKVRLSRCSFISSANAEGLLKDSTGNRRFMVFELDNIQFAYAGWTKEQIKGWQGQCLAQMVRLAEEKYKASGVAWREMNAYIEQQTPSDAADEIVEQFYAYLKRSLDFGFSQGDELSFADVSVVEAISKVSKDTGLRVGGVKTMLKRRIGVYRRVNTKRLWKLKAPEAEVMEIGEGAVDGQIVNGQLVFGEEF